MALYKRLGSFLVADTLAPVPCGAIHRALSTVGTAFERHYLLLTCSDELLNAGLASGWQDAQRAASLLAGVRGVGGGYRLDNAKPLHLACDHVPGRTLAQVMVKTREEQIPLGVDHALTLLQSMGQAILALHDKNLHHGTLSPHSIWVSYEGAAQIIDAPLGAVLEPLVAKIPALQAALAPYRRAGQATPFQQDLFAMGSILYELLTLEKLPTGAALPKALTDATLKAAQEDGPVPQEILQLLQRLLMVGEPFTTAADFNAALERVLYEGDYSPTTFNMAFLMHTLFREESEREAQAMKEDLGTNFAPYLPAGESVPAGAKAGKTGNRTLYYALGGAGVVVAAMLGGMFYLIHQGNQQHMIEQRSLQDKLAAFQKEKEANDAKLAEIAKQEDAAKELETMFGQQAAQASTADARAAAKKDLEAAKQKTRDLAKQRAEALKEKQKLTQLAQSAPRPAAAQPQAAPVPVPVPAAAPLPTPAVALAQTAGTGPDTPPAVTQKGVAQAPRAGTRDTLPPSMQQSEIKVSLKVFVDAMGRPQKVVIVKGVDGNYGYNDNAQSAALASSFAPGTRNGKPASGWLNMEYNFGKPK